MPICTVRNAKKPHIYKKGAGWCVCNGGYEVQFASLREVYVYCYLFQPTEGKNKTDRKLRQQCLAKRHEKSGKAWT